MVAAEQAVLDAQAWCVHWRNEASSGQAAAIAAARNPYVLMGVLADRRQVGAALISVDGKAAKPFALGSGSTVTGCSMP